MSLEEQELSLEEAYGFLSEESRSTFISIAQFDLDSAAAGIEGEALLDVLLDDTNRVVQTQYAGDGIRTEELAGVLSALANGSVIISSRDWPDRDAAADAVAELVIFNLKENDLVGLRGPYGTGFPVEKMQGKDIVIVMGGLGAAPLRSVLLYCLDNRDQFGRVILLHGAKRPGEMLFREEQLELKRRDDLECFLTVDADDTGQWTEDTGVVTTLFSGLENINPENTIGLVCGPPVMYKFVLQEFLKLEIPKDQILMTLERRMKCGVGKCGHCAIDYIYTCLDGPVFSYWDVIHMRELI